ncbi:MAG: hypothetical protein V2A79_14620, partial [Planctomycetota bacterium]
AGQWGSALSFACNFFGLTCTVPVTCVNGTCAPGTCSGKSGDGTCDSCDPGSVGTNCDTCDVGHTGALCDECTAEAFGVYPYCFLAPADFCDFNSCWPVPPTEQSECSDDASIITCPASGAAYYGQDAQYPGQDRQFVCYDKADPILSAGSQCSRIAGEIS